MTKTHRSTSHALIQVEAELAQAEAELARHIDQAMDEIRLFLLRCKQPLTQCQVNALSADMAFLRRATNFLEQ